MNEHQDDPTRDITPRASGHSLGPVGFSIGVALILVGLVISWPAMVIGAAIAIGLRPCLDSRLGANPRYGRLGLGARACRRRVIG